MCYIQYKTSSLMTDAGYQHDENGLAWGISCNKERRMNLIKQIRMLNEVWNVIGLVFVSFFTYIYVGDLKITILAFYDERNL